jgi:glycerophosphoryl diester phosphodiesterase
MRRRRIVAGVLGAALIAVYLNNASWLAPVPTGRPGVLAHRGVHQTYPSEPRLLTACTATHINKPTNPYLENTIPSMKAGFTAGATAEELDVHPTTDGEFAVFHDWDLECRTNGHGVTRDQPMAYLKTLDVGYGYTADGGKTFPFRGKGVGLMPTLQEVLSTFPGKQFLINIKSNDPHESDQLVDYLKAHGHPIDHRLWGYAADRPIDRLEQRAPQAMLMSKKRGQKCAFRYLALGWSGYVPHACRDGVIGVPINLRSLYWGWPNRFLARMKSANVLVVLIDPVGRNAVRSSGNSGANGIANLNALDAIPPGFPGMILTNDVEKLGPEVRRRFGG